jgi:hypothetical protein
VNAKAGLHRGPAFASAHRKRRLIDEADAATKTVAEEIEPKALEPAR